MKTRWHIALGLIPSIIFFFLGFSFLEISVFFLSSFFFIDLDHVPRFVLKERSINPIKFLKVHDSRKNFWIKISKKQQKLYKKPIFFFHNIETLIILVIGSFFYPILFFVFIGFLFHLSTDLIYQVYHNHEKHYKISLIYTLIKNKNKKEFL